MNRQRCITFILLIFLSSVKGQSPWVVEAKNIDKNNYYGVTLANGMIGLVSSPEALKVKDVVLNGVYDYYQRGRVSNILKGFNHVNMNLDIDGQRVGEDQISEYRQSLDMQHAVLNTSFNVADKAVVRSEMRALRHLPYTSLIVFTITANKAIDITPMSVIEAPNHLSDVRQYYAEIDRPHVKIPLLTSVALSPSGKIKIAASNSFIFNERHGSEPQLIHEEWDYNMHLVKFHKHLVAGESYSFSIVASTVSSVHYQDTQNEAERLSIYAMLEGKEKLIRMHEKQWGELWKSNITIEGDDDVTRDIRFALYHLYSFGREGTAMSLSPMGLSGLGYNGHVFWDTELWMYPPMLLMHPEIARSFLDYRFDRLEKAKQNAFAHGYKGAMYPWESSAEGSEDTPVWALTGPFQHHITGCVGWAFWKYFQVTGDKIWLKEKGWPVLKEVADFWASRVERNGLGHYDIKNVIGANEWEENIDNNAFTNGMAMTVLRYADQAARVLGIEPDPDWLHVADNIPLLKFPDGVTKENESYEGVTIKQADVNLLAYPLEIVTERDQVKKDLDYYLPRMAKDGPAMGAAILAIMYNRLGETDRASEIFTKSYKPNEVPPFGVLSETAGGTNPYFATGAGGMLQAVLSGFGGLNITNEGIIQSKTNIPKTWKKLIITGVGPNDLTFEVK